MRRIALMAAVAAVALPASALAQPSSQPPENALPLSQILSILEEREDVAFFDEVEWDSDGYWEVEFYRTDGAKIEIDVDPVSGETR